MGEPVNTTAGRGIHRDYYVRLFRTCTLDKKDAAGRFSLERKIGDGRSRYEHVESMTGVPWVFTALVHLMECGCNFDRQIINGERWDMRTTLHPKGKGPWKSWEEAAVEALRRVKDVAQWDVPEILYQLERWNGLGYYHRGVHSAYLWSHSNHGDNVGKFTADGHYDPDFKSAQIGAGVMLRHLIWHGIWPSGVDFWPVRYDEEGLCLRITVSQYQKALNVLGPNLKEDGWAGPKTSKATSYITGHYLLGDPRNER